MSSNPFRRQPPQELPLDNQPTTAGKSFEEAANQSIEDKGRKPSTTKKVVRIQTPPPLSPDPVSSSFGDQLIRKISNEPRAGSPPPAALPVDAPPPAAARELDPLSANFSAEISSQDPTVIANTRRNSEGGVTSPPLALAAKVLNPFQKTLANTEPSEDGGAPSRAGEPGRDQSGSGAAPIDFNTFTKMLMTGEGGPTPAELGNASASAGGPGQAQPGGSANTVPVNFDELEDASSEDEGPLAPLKSQSSKEAPPPPKHKHGKSINERAPQTVSFNDFEEDLDSTDRSRQIASQPDRKGSDPDSSKRRLPPPPPLSRRPTSGSFEPSGPLSPGSQQTAGSKAQKVPPPPPARRGANRNSVHADAASEAGNGSEGMFDTTWTRRALNAGHEVSSRSSSVSEHRGAAAPPPPPTRRPRGSSKSSMENQAGATLRSNAEGRKPHEDTRRSSQDSARRAAALGQVDEGDGQTSRDVLADLSAFQAEVDALRKSYRT